MGSTDEIAKPPQLVAPRFLRDAEDYVESARQLDALHGGIVRKWVSPIYQLLCHAIELTLKAYLAASGVPITTLANHIGHDLELAFRCAQKHGFTPSDGRFWEVVQLLAPYHLDHLFWLWQSPWVCDLSGAIKSSGDRR